MPKAEAIDAIIVELQRKFIVHVLVEYQNPSYVDFFESHTLTQIAEHQFELNSVSSNDYAGTATPYYTATFDEAGVRTWLNKIDENFVVDARVEEFKDAKYRPLLSERANELKG